MTLDATLAQGTGTDLPPPVDGLAEPDPTADLRSGPAGPPDGPERLGLHEVLARAVLAPFHRDRDTAAGWSPAEPLTWQAWRRVPPMTKDELRALDDLDHTFCLAPRSEIVEYWRSGGVTGRPVFYPRTARDVEASLEAFARTVRAAGLSAADTLHLSLPLGIHPAGQQLARAVQRVGAAAVWAGAGNQTPASEQVRQVHAMGATVWAGMPSFGLTLAEKALEEGMPLAGSGVRLLLTSAERMSPAKRARLEQLWDARVVDVFGMSELTLLGLECATEPGFHLWSDVVFTEVLDETTLEAVGEDRPGLLCVTPLTTGHATPFVRWLSGDVVTAHRGCGCPLAAHPRIVHTGRLRSFFKVRGVNVSHDELENLLLGQQEVADFRAVARDGRELVLEVEARGDDPELPARLARLVQETFGLRPVVRQVARGTVDRLTGTQVKAQRFVDEGG